MPQTISWKMPAKHAGSKEVEPGPLFTAKSLFLSLLILCLISALGCGYDFSGTFSIKYFRCGTGRDANFDVTGEANSFSNVKILYIDGAFSNTAAISFPAQFEGNERYLVYINGTFYRSGIIDDTTVVVSGESYDGFYGTITPTKETYLPAGKYRVEILISEKTPPGGVTSFEVFLEPSLEATNAKSN